MLFLSRYKNNTKGCIMVLKKRYKSLLVELTLFTLFIFFFYDIIWMIIDFDNFYNLLTTSMDTFLLNFLIDLFYCVVFASINITSKNVIFNNKFRRRNSVSYRNLVCSGFLLLSINVVLAFLCEFVLDVMDSELPDEDFLGNAYFFCFVSCILSFVMLLIEYSRIIDEKEKARVELQKKLLSMQLNPHFIFNSFNVLNGLISTNQELALKFSTKLARFYRVVLSNMDNDLISIDNALNMARDYVDLLNIRFGNRICLEIERMSVLDDECVLPGALQLTIENAVKHNHVRDNCKLYLTIKRKDDMLVLKNNRIQSKDDVVEADSCGIGLKNLFDRYNLICECEPVVKADASFYEIMLPIIKRKKL